jgi:hypothetical protein
MVFEVPEYIRRMKKFNNNNNYNNSNSKDNFLNKTAYLSNE